MSFIRFSESRRVAQTFGRSRARTVVSAAALAVCENLEPRRLLTTYLYEAPAGYTSARLEEVSDAPGQVRVFLDDETTPAYTFLNTVGMDVIDGSDIEGFLFVDQVPASLKPLDDDDDHQGIKVVGGDESKLRLEAGNEDTLIQVNDSIDPNDPEGDFWPADTVVVTDNTGFVGFTAYDGIEYLTLRTNDVVADKFRGDTVSGTSGTDVMVRRLGSGIHLEVNTGGGTYDRMTLGKGDSLGLQVTVVTGAGHDVVNIQESDGDDETLALIDFGTGTGSGSGLGLGNILNVHGAGTAILGSSSHRVVVDEVNVSNGGNLLVEHASTIGNLQVTFGGAATLEVDGTTVTTFGISSGGTAYMQRQTTIGAFTVDGTANFAGTSSPSTVTQFAVTGSVQGSTGVVNVNSGAEVTILTSSKMGTLNIPGTGKLTLQARPTGGSARHLAVGSLNMGTTPTGKLDLRDNAMIVDYPSDSTPYSSIKSLLTSGYAARVWNGNGIMSSSVAEGPAAGEIGRTAIGYGEASALGFTSFADYTFDGNAVLVKYTYEGDASLDGQVDITDLGRLATGWPTSGDWWQGDFDYSGIVNTTDLGMLATNWLLGVGGPLFAGGDPQEQFLEGIEELGLSEEQIAILLEMLGEGGGETL
jgi:hypothetical protein